MSDGIVENMLLMAGSFAYGFLVIGIGVAIQKRMKKDPSYTRKVIHIFVGFCSFVTFWFSPGFAWLSAIVGCCFTFLVYLSRPAGPLHAMFDAMARDGDVNAKELKGPLYYAIMLTILTSIFAIIPALLPLYWIPASCLAMMFLGDGVAPIVGKRWGRHRYGKYNRSVEGSLAVFAMGFAGSLFTILLGFFTSTTQSIPANLAMIILLLVIVSGINTIVEAITPGGLDNITCPAASAASMIFLFLLLF
jgi:phytol kinase